jgi:hypothetical protein
MTDRTKPYRITRKTRVKARRKRFDHRESLPVSWTWYYAAR